MYELFIQCGKHAVTSSWFTVTTLGHSVSSRLRRGRLLCNLKQNEIRHLLSGSGLEIIRSG